VRGRGPVVHLDRTAKARMITAVLADHLGRPVTGLRTLDIGCGNGGISELLAADNEHHAVDIADRRRVRSTTYDFRLVDSERLPFQDQYFDVVVSHHVIEHVNDQGLHLDEIRRVLKPEGVAYIATPNRSSPIMEGHVGNDRVLRYRNMTPLFRRHGFGVREYGLRIVKEPDRFHGEVRQGRHLPLSLLRLLRPLYPSHVFVLTQPDR
jgi:2-polyprenyl-3-methyl-5-hydroxy-6-metoxy-1,4-benzoquinol methylase